MVARGGRAVNDHDGHTINVGPITVADAIHVERAGQCRHDGEPWPCATRQRDRARDEVRRLRAENATLRAQQCPHNSKTFGQCIVCGWTGRPACSECGEPVRPDWECCSMCGAWENALEAVADPIDTDRMVSRCQDWGNDDAEEAAREMCAEVDRLRDLLRQALPWIDPNDRHEDYLLTVAIREALGEPT